MTEKENSDEDIGGKIDSRSGNAYGFIESEPVLHGYVFWFSSQEGADQAIKDWWAQVWSTTPDKFTRGMWKPAQQLTGGLNYRTEPVLKADLLRKTGKSSEVVAGYYIHGNGIPLVEKGLAALRKLYLLI